MSVDDVVSGPPRTAIAEEHLGREFDQAWEHYRHLEILRNQYLNYALTVTLAIIAASVPLANIVKDSPGLLTLAAGLVLMYALFVAMTCAGVFKLRSLNNHYYLVFLTIRAHLLTTGPSTFDQRILGRRGYGGRAPFNRLLNIQGWSESILMTMLALASVSSAGVAFKIYTLEPQNLLFVIATAAVAVIALLILVVASVTLTMVRRTERKVLAGPEWAEVRRQPGNA